jgi:hypothetical protein
MRCVRRADLLAAAMALTLALQPAAGAAMAASVVRVAPPPDFSPRFMTVCQRRGYTDDYCTCMVNVVLREVADENLALMLDYFENPRGFDSRALEELDNDETRMRMLAEEIAAAQEATRSECRQR